MEILSIIPARGGSKGIKRKNIKPILDKPLIAYTIEASLNSKYITKTILSSENDEILQIAQNYGAQTLKRPDYLAQDETKTAPVMLNVIEELERREDYHADFVVLLQPTCPLRDCDYIDCAFEYYFKKMNEEGFDSCFSAFDIGFTHAKWRILHDNKLESLYDFRIRPRRQEIDEHYKMICENGAFYALPVKILKEAKDFIGYNPCAYVTPRVIDIDTIEDFCKVEKILMERNKCD